MVPNYKELLRQNIHRFDFNYNSTSNVSKKIEILTNYFHENVLKIFGKNVPNNSRNTSGNMFNDRPKWFDENCYNAKKDFKNSRNIFNKNKTAENRTACVKMHTKYNKIGQKAKYNYKKKEGQCLENIAKSQPKKFSKSLKNGIENQKFE